MLRYEDISQVHIELSSYCNSACPTCPRNIDSGIVSPELAPVSLSLEDFKKVLPVELLSRLRSMNMCGNYGDPIMCKDMTDIVSYIQSHNKNIKLAIHTNGGVRSEEFWTQLGTIISTMPNTHVVFSIDGLEDTNHLYRIGVDWPRLMKNVQAYIAAGGHAVWDFLVFKHNEHQVVEAEKLSAEMGFRSFVKGKPHGFKYNGKMRVVDNKGKFLRHIDKSSMFDYPSEGKSFDSIDFDTNINDIAKNYQAIRNITDEELKKFSSLDNLEIKNCTAVHIKEIYIDSNGGVHPCCYLGHISQDALPISELVYHKRWIEETIGLGNINALNKPIKDIIESYFSIIEQSWSKTFAQGRNPMCAFKCGYQRQSGLIRH